MSNKVRPARNPVVQQMIQRTQNAGRHIDQKKEENKNLSRQPIDQEAIDEPFNEREIDEPVMNHKVEAREKGLTFTLGELMEFKEKLQKEQA